MSRVIDCILFHSELEVLKIRLEYLYEVVDKFIILESSQSFSGKKKPFNFEKNKELFKKFQDKIIYNQLNEHHSSIDDIYKRLNKEQNVIFHNVRDILTSHCHYSKKRMDWVLDSYQREYLHIAMDSFCKKDDMIIFSDLDEIPSLEFIDYCKNTKFDNFKTAKQKEFNIYLNCYKNFNWIGTIIGYYSSFKNQSLNLLRKESKESDNEFVEHLSIDGGYHFSWIGNKDQILNKLNSTAHQEFNFNFVKKKLNSDLMAVKYLFAKKNQNEYQAIDINNFNFFDKKMSFILSKYSNLILSQKISTEMQKKNTIFDKMFFLFFFIAHRAKIKFKNIYDYYKRNI